MGILLSLETAYELTRILVPSFIEASLGRLERDTADKRLQSFGRRVVTMADMKLEVTGADLVPRDRAFVFMSNHQSHLDIPVLYATVPAKTLRMVAKAELYRIPLWQRTMTAAGFIKVDRRNHAQAMASMRQAGQEIRAGVSIWIAPEGTRTKTGSLNAFKKGGFYLAKETNTPIVPITINGTRHALPSGSIHTRPNCQIKVAFGAPIPVEGRAISDLMGEVRDFMESHLG